MYGFYNPGLSGLTPDYAIGPPPVRCSRCDDPCDLPRSLADAGWTPLCGKPRCSPPVPPAGLLKTLPVAFKDKR